MALKDLANVLPCLQQLSPKDRADFWDCRAQGRSFMVIGSQLLQNAAWWSGIADGKNRLKVDPPTIELTGRRVLELCSGVVMELDAIAYTSLSPFQRTMMVVCSWFVVTSYIRRRQEDDARQTTASVISLLRAVVWVPSIFDLFH
jgi:hypothetical protein